MFSLNVPVPGAVRGQAETFRPLLGTGARAEYTLVAKRLVTATPRPVIETRVRQALADVSPFRARTTHVDVFESPTTGSGTVVYLAVDSDGLHAVHETLCAVVSPVPDVEGAEYTPHVTLGRTDDPAVVEAVLDREIDPVTWTVSTLTFYAADTHTVTGQLTLSP
ncbi:MAG: 2'-5' RNA ligase family protein [Halobacteriaceae archaeon]